MRTLLILCCLQTSQASLLALLFLFALPCLQAQEAPRPEAAPDKPEKIVRFQEGKLYGFQGFFSEKRYVEPRFEHLEYNYSDCMAARLNGRTGLIDDAGKTRVPFEYEAIRKPVVSKETRAKQQKISKPIFFTWFLAQKNGAWGLIDSTGKTMEPFDWEDAYFVNDTIVMLTRKGMLQLSGPSGQIYLNEKVDRWAWANPDNFHRTLLIKIQKGEEIGVIDELGRIVVPLQYRKLRWFTGGFVCMENADSQQAIFNRQGQKIVPEQASEMYYSGDGLFLVVQDRKLGQSGMIDSSGHTVLPFEFAECRTIRDEGGGHLSPFLMTRRLKQKAYTIHALDGRQLTEPVYTEAFWSTYAPTLLFVQLPDNSWRMLRENGELLHEAYVFTRLEVSGRTIIGSKENAGNAFFQLDGTQVTGFDYSSARALTNDYQAVEFARRLGLDSHLKLLGEASRKGLPQVFITVDGQELILPKE